MDEPKHFGFSFFNHTFLNMGCLHIFVIFLNTLSFLDNVLKEFETFSVMRFFCFLMNLEMSKPSIYWSHLFLQHSFELCQQSFVSHSLKNSEDSLFKSSNFFWPKILEKKFKTSFKRQNKSEASKNRQQVEGSFIIFTKTFLFWVLKRNISQLLKDHAWKGL